MILMVSRKSTPDGGELVVSQEQIRMRSQKFSLMELNPMILPKEVLETATLLQHLQLFLNGMEELRSYLLRLR
jgi:hypothetical protein